MPPWPVSEAASSRWSCVLGNAVSSLWDLPTTPLRSEVDGRLCVYQTFIKCFHCCMEGTRIFSGSWNSWRIAFVAGWHNPFKFHLYIFHICLYLESPLDCKEIQPVHPKGDQLWVFIGGTDVEAKTPILWQPDAKSWLVWKDPDVGKDWRWKKKGRAEDEMVGWHHQLNGHEFE